MKKLVLLLTALVLCSCSSSPLNLPSVSTEVTGVHLPGKVIWHDLVTDNPEAAKRFYNGLFGWQFKSLPGGAYHIILHGDRAIGGMVDARNFEQHDNVSQWVVALSVIDVEAAVETVKKAGGKIFGGPADLGDRGRLALVADPQGAIVALLQTPEGDPAEREAAAGEFMWNELWTTDTAGATAFYKNLVGYQPGQLNLAGGDSYHYLKSGDRPRVAIIDNPIEGLNPTWVSYVKVEDTDSVTAKVEDLGGQLMLPGQQNPVGGELAIIRDPSGAGFIIQTWNRNQQEPTP